VAAISEQGSHFETFIGKSFFLHPDPALLFNGTVCEKTSVSFTLAEPFNVSGSSGFLGRSRYGLSFINSDLL
jgi:hypothetical protein